MGPLWFAFLGWDGAFIGTKAGQWWPGLWPRWPSGCLRKGRPAPAWRCPRPPPTSARAPPPPEWGPARAFLVGPIALGALADATDPQAALLFSAAVAAVAAAMVAAVRPAEK